MNSSDNHHVDEWIDYLQSFPDPKDDIERMRFHYLCKHHFTSGFRVALYNIISCPVLLISFILTLFYQIYRLCKKRYKEDYDAVEFIVEGNKVATLQELGCPEKIEQDYPKRYQYRQKRGKALFCTGTLSIKLILFWFKCVRRYPFSFYMNFYLLTHLTAIEKILMNHHPKAIITTETENDYCSSVISEYCEKNGTNYIGIMHGEYLLSLNHAFVRLSEFYVWDQYYIQQFEITRSDPSFFVVFQPQRFHMVFPETEKKWDIAYYLQEQNEDDLLHLKGILARLNDMGYSCKVRPHPSETDLQTLGKVFQDSCIQIERNDQIKLEVSLAESKYIVSQFSTVLSEAYYNGLDAVVDDISDPELFRQLKADMYINIDRIGLRLSDFFTDTKNQCKNTGSERAT